MIPDGGGTFPSGDLALGSVVLVLAVVVALVTVVVSELDLNVEPIRLRRRRSEGNH